MIRRWWLMAGGLALAACAAQPLFWSGVGSPTCRAIRQWQTYDSYGLLTYSNTRASATVTITGWLKLVDGNVAAYESGWVTTRYLISTEPPYSTAEDICGDEWWPTNQTLNGEESISVTLADDYGYTCVGWAENPCTVDVGGNSMVVTGAFDRSILAGPTDAIALTTTGAVRCGVIAMQTNEWHGAVDGFLSAGGLAEGLTATSTFSTNEFRFITWEYSHMSPSNRVVSCLWGRTNDVPFMLCLTNWHSSAPIKVGNLFKVGIQPLGVNSGRVDRFDFRVFHRQLSPVEWARVRMMGRWELDYRNLE